MITKEEKEALLTKMAESLTNGFHTKLMEFTEKSVTADPAQCAKDLRKSVEDALWKEMEKLSPDESRALLHSFLADIGIKQLRQTLGAWLEKQDKKNPDDGFAC